MRNGNFRFAVAQALVLAAAAVGVAVSFHLPLRDPDGVSVPTYLRLPAILLAAFLTDVLPRAVRRADSLRHVASELGAVVRERWGRDHVRFAFVGLGAWYLTYVAFRNLKSYVPFVNRRLWDDALARFDRILWLGNDPADVLHQVLGTGVAAHVMSFVYVAWIVLVPASLAVALVWSRSVRAGEWFVTAVAADWVLGVATYFLVPTLGPVYAEPGDFAALPHTWVSTLQASMIQERYDVLADPFATQAVQTIAAFASLHVGICVTTCLIAELLRMPRCLRISLWAFLGLTVVATVYLGWHYFADAIGGAVIGAAGLLIAAWGTGNHVRGIPRRVQLPERQESFAEPR
ncbi:MAG: phosphatase PAP2 family protein [Nocardioides sp.]